MTFSVVEHDGPLSVSCFHAHETTITTVSQYGNIRLESTRDSFLDLLVTRSHDGYEYELLYLYSSWWARQRLTTMMDLRRREEEVSNLVLPPRQAFVLSP
jgi:hypothetical protein